MKKLLVSLVMLTVGGLALHASSTTHADNVSDGATASPRHAIDPEIELTQQEKDFVTAKAKPINSATKEKYDALVAAWHKNIMTNSETMFSSDTKTYTILPEFKELKNMGQTIIPLVLESLLTQDNFYLLTLYDALQENKDLVASNGENSPYKLESEQNRAKRTIRMWVNSLSSNAKK